MSRPAEPAQGERRLSALAWVAIGATLCAVFWPLAAGRLFLYGDLGNFVLPIRLFYADQLALGESPLWMPHLFCGFHLHGEGQLGIYHPFRRLAYSLLPVDAAFAHECVLPLPLALLGFTLFLRRLGLPSSAALFGGVCFGFSPYLTLRLAHLGTLAILAHVGWLLAAIDAVMRGRPGGRRDAAWIALALLTASQLLLGYPPAVVLSVLVEVGYAAVLLFRGAGLAPLCAVLAAKLVGLLLGAPQWLPTWEDLGDSLRADTSYAFRNEQSLHPANLLLPLSPWLFRDRVYQVENFNPIEQAFYLGAVAPIAIVWILARGKQLAPWRRSGTLALLATSALALILALGRYLPVHRLLFELPLLGLLRVPSRYTLVVSLACAVLAALAFADLRRTAAAKGAKARGALRAIWLVPALAWVIALVALLLRQEPATSEPWGLGSIRPPGTLLWGPVLLTLAAALFSAAARGLRFAPAALFSFALLDLGTYGATLWWSEPPLRLTEYLASVPSTPSVPPERLMTYSVMSVERTAAGQGRYVAVTRLSVHDTRLVVGYVGLMPARRLDYSRPRVLRLAGASHAEIDGRFLPLAQPFPRARLLSRSVVSSTPMADLPGIDLSTTALVETPIELVPAPPGRASVLEDVPGRMRVRTQSPTRQLLVLSEAHHAGWKASCDGAPCPPQRVYGDFLGVVVEAGVHETLFRFEPDSFERGLRLGLLGAVGLVGFPWVAVVARRRAAGGAADA